VPKKAETQPTVHDKKEAEPQEEEEEDEEEEEAVVKVEPEAVDVRTPHRPSRPHLRPTQYWHQFFNHVSSDV
jgi:hypothetical protein